MIAGLLFATLSKSPMTEEYIAQAVFGCVGGAALGGVAHVLTRKKEPGETFFMQKPKEARPDSSGVKVCTFVGALVGFALMMIGNLVFRVVVGGAVGGAIGATVGGAVGRALGQLLFPESQPRSTSKE